MTFTNSAAKRGRFIAFEGGDGSGKSTQAARLADSLEAVLTREPGGTPIGNKIRDLVLDPSHPELTSRTEALLMAAARAQHVEERILPDLLAGRDVISDRFVASSLAYQGVGRDLGIDTIADLNEFAINGLVPDLTVLLDVEPAAARNRLGVTSIGLRKRAPISAARSLRPTVCSLPRHPTGGSWSMRPGASTR